MINNFVLNFVVRQYVRATCLLRISPSPTLREAMASAAAKLKLIKDPWDKFEIDKYPVENVVRHRYNPLKKSWKSDDCVVRMESKQFANGAMRSCFRM